MLQKYTKSLRYKIIVSILLVSTVFLGIFQGYLYYELNVALVQELNDNADQKVRRLSRDLDIPMWEFDEIWVKKILQSELLDQQVHAIVISGEEDFLVKMARDKSSDNHSHENIIKRMHPIVHNGVKIGVIELYLTKDILARKLAYESKRAILFTFFEIVLIILFLWIMIRHLVIRPVELLVVATDRIANGDYSHDDIVLDDDEIGHLGLSITRMKHKIQMREKELSLSNLSLSMIKEQLEYAVNGTQDGLWDWKIGTDYIYLSPRFKAILGYQENEFPNSLKAWEDSVHPDDMPDVQKAIDISHSAPGHYYENIHRVRRKDGTWIWVLDRAQTVFDENNKPVRMVGFYTDISKQKELEQEIIAQENVMIAQSRHVAMGEMIGMIAHQWRQPITVIAMDANNILADIALNETTEENLTREASHILKQTEYLSKTIDDFRNFFRQNKEQDETKVVDVLLEAKEVMGKSLEYHNISLLISSDETQPISTYSRELLQVFLNIIKNSKDAIEQRNVTEGYINIEVKTLEDDIVIDICDNGGGIKEDIILHIFEPYYTTKDKKTGTGLGLYMSKTIVDKHLHGHIDVHNADFGVCFTITIPKITDRIEHD